MPDYKTGERLRSQLSAVQFVVVRADSGAPDITCNGHPLSREGDSFTPSENQSAEGDQIQIGKRYEDEAATIELLCVSPGRGDLALAGSPLKIKVPKPLPASD